MAVYGSVLWMAGMAYYILTRVMISSHGKDSTLAIAIGKDAKGMLSLVGYTVAILLAFVNPYISFALYVVIAILWLIPDTRIERNIGR